MQIWHIITARRYTSGVHYDTHRAHSEYKRVVHGGILEGLEDHVAVRSSDIGLCAIEWDRWSEAAGGHLLKNSEDK